MKKLLLSLSSVLMAFSASAFSVNGGDKFELVQSVDELNTTDTYILCYDKVAMGSQNGTAYRNPVKDAITLTGNTATIVDGKASDIYAFKLAKGTKDNTFAFNVGTDQAPTYLSCTSATNGKVTTSTTIVANCNVTFTLNNDGTFKIPFVNTATTDAVNIFQYNANSGQERFTNYKTGTQKNCKIYKYILDDSKTATPVISCKDNNVYISCATEGAEIYYTIDGTEPSSSSNKYTAPFEISSTVTVSAIAYFNNVASSISSAKCFYIPTGNLTVPQALTLIQDEYEGPLTVEGIISSIKSFNSTYGSITYYISDNGTISNQLQIYGGLGLNGKKFESLESIELGAKVVVEGYNCKIFNGEPEIDLNSILLSYEAPVSEGPVDYEAPFADQEYTITIGEVWNLPVGTSHPAEFAMDAEEGSEFVEIDEDALAITGKAAGTATIYVYWDGSDKFNEGEAYFTIKVEEAGSNPEPTTGTIQNFTSGIGLPDSSANVPTAAKEYTATDTNITYTIYGCYMNSGYMMINGKNYANAYISWKLGFNMAELVMTTSGGCSTAVNNKVNVYANGNIIAESLAVNKINTSYTVKIPEEYRAAGTVYKVEYDTPASNPVNSQFVSFAYNISTGIDGIEAEDAAPVYYNLQGVRVANPEKGLYIVVKGNKAEKVIF